jgi:GAF domain-containing protein
MSVMRNNVVRVLLLDCDPTFVQVLAAELREEGILVDSVIAEGELLDRLQNSHLPLELVMLGRLAEVEREGTILTSIRRQAPWAGVIRLTDTPQAWQVDWQAGSPLSVDRFAGGRVLAFVIRTVLRLRAERQHSRTLEALVSAAGSVGVAQSEEQLYQQLYEEACELLPGLDGFLIVHYDEEAGEVSFPFSYKHHKRIHIQSRRNGNRIAEYVLLTKEPLLLPFGDEMFRIQHGLNPPDENLGYASSEIVVPMFLEGGKVYGAVFASTNDPNIRYTAEHLQALTAFTAQAVLTIRNFIHIQEANQLRDATAALAGQSGREGVLRAIIEGAHKIMNSDFTGMILLNEDGSLQKARPVIPEAFFRRFGKPRQEGGLTRSVIESRKPRIIPDTSRSELVKESVRAAGIKSMLVLPLIHCDRVLAVLYTHTFTIRDFTARDVALWSAFATQAAGALDRVLEQERKIRDYQRLVMELGNLEEPLSFQETLVRVATTAKSVFVADSCHLFYIDLPTGRVMDSAWAEDDPPEQQNRSLDQPGGLILKYGRRQIGVMHCNYFTKKPPYDEHYKTLLEAFGARAAVAMLRAAREHKSEIWHELDREILNCTSVRQLYELFARKAHEALGADFSVFHPFQAAAGGSGWLPVEEECIRLGSFRAPWRQPRGGRGGGVFEHITGRKPLLIVNDLAVLHGRFASRLSRREKIRAFVAMRLDVLLPDMNKPGLAGILFLNYRQPAAFREVDLADMQSASKLIAAGIIRLRLQMDLQQAYKQRNNQLRAVIEIFRTHEEKSQISNLDHIAEHAARALGLDICTILEFHPLSQKFTGRGDFGLLHPEYRHARLRSRFKDVYMHRDGPVVLPDVRRDPLMRSSKFVKREGVCSTLVCPLRAEGESLGLIFGNYRRHTEPPRETVEAFGLFADVAAHVLHQANLNTRLVENQFKEDRRRLLVWVSMVEDMWQHTLVQKASTIRNHAYTLGKRLVYIPHLPEPMASIPEIIAEMGKLAGDIANAPPRVPHDSEMKSEMVPIGPLLQEIAEREYHSMRLQGSQPYQIDVDVKGLGGVQVRGYRRWLIYTFESLFLNAYTAMPRGGRILVTGSKQKGWAEIRIQDTGRGVPLPLRDKLFKVPITARRRSKGLGIGTLLVTTLVEENGGTIELEKPGPGDTTVLIRLPIERQAKRS